LNTKLYVGNLPYSVTETDLRSMFAPAGEIASVAVITDRDTGRPRGFAFVEMVDAAAAQKAITLVNGKTLGDRQLTVNEAKPQPARYSSGGGGGYGGGRDRR
jgi:cold-inducible RNA-binding protein